MTNIITPVNLDDLDGIEADANQASPGPWIAQITTEGYLRVSADPNAINGICGFGDMEDTDIQDHHNAVFVARARMYVPALTAQVRKLRSRVAALEAQLKEAGHEVALT